MKAITRRELLRKSLAGAGILASAAFGSCGVFDTIRPPKNALPRTALDRVPLGKTGINASFLAMGTGFKGSRRTSALTRMGDEHALEVLRYALNQGINFLDMADLYGSHPFVGKILKDVPRDKLVLLTKMQVYPASWTTPSDGAVEEVDRFRKELGVDMIDVVLLHCMRNDQWPEQFKRVRDELSEFKQKGVVRAVGCSCHNHGALQVAAEHPWVDVIFARINNVGGKEMKMDGTVEEISQTLRTARANGKAVVGMKIYGEGKLVKPEEMDASLQYVLGNDLVDAITIGMLKKEEVDDNIARINRILQA